MGQDEIQDGAQENEGDKAKEKARPNIVAAGQPG